ncbi:uncharacterized protein LOC119391844 [Rhipicephalus sanguineus]|uniref:uncharacterized protein LOC119391844 n=1 Tax=Rhipicephalus sanguineus TaxID=34632 RepID=UPI001896214D|nr:uncharacterized protein LOC119391844 [Rhipicephalus sanguineus]
MDALKLKRKAERAQLTRLINEIEATIDQDAVTEEQLCILTDRLTQLHTDLRATDSAIVPLLSTTEAEAEFDRVVEYNDRATATCAKLKYRLRRFHESQNSPLPETPIEPVQRTHQPAVQLPKVDIMKFDGQPSVWTPFWEQFSQLIHNNGRLTDVDRFNYLRSVLTGDAALAIAGLPATASCYAEALDILKNRFAKTDVIIQTHMQRLIDIQPVRSSNDLQGLRCLYDTVQSQTRALKSLGVPEDNYFAMLYPILLKALPHDLVIDFNKTIARQSTQQREQGGNTGQHSQELKAGLSMGQ